MLRLSNHEHNMSKSSLTYSSLYNLQHTGSVHILLNLYLSI